MIGQFLGVARGEEIEAMTSEHPVIDTHIHYWTLPRVDGSSFPEGFGDDLSWLLRDKTLKEYAGASPKASRRVEGIVLVESSVNIDEGRATVDANQYMLKVAEREDLIIGVVGKLSLKDPDFSKHLHQLSRHPKFVGLRVPGQELKDESGGLDKRARMALEEIASHGLTIDILSGVSMRELVGLAAEMPTDLHIIIDHFGPVEGDLLTLPADYMEAVLALASRENIFMKVSDLQRKSGPSVGGAWPVPYAGLKEVEAYRPLLDFLLNSWGERRLMWGSNWPVSDLAGPWGEQLEIWDAYLKDKDESVRDWIYRRTAQVAYDLR